MITTQAHFRESQISKTKMIMTMRMKMKQEMILMKKLNIIKVTANGELDQLENL